MEFLASIFSILCVLFIAVISPGPRFLLVAQMSISTGRSDGVAAAMGIGVGAVVFAALVLVGLHAMLTGVPFLYAVLKICGGIYLLHLAMRSWSGAARPLFLVHAAIRPKSNRRHAFFLALGAMLNNPKAMMQYGAVFAALLPHKVSIAQSAILATSIFMLEAGWCLVVALVLSSAVPCNAYLKSRSAIDRIAGIVMALLGIKLIVAW